jgi:hypothetical protein
MYMSKTSISSRMKKFRRGLLRIFPLDGQIQGEVVVGTIVSLEYWCLQSRLKLACVHGGRVVLG